MNRRLNENNGITLIAIVISVIIMLILVAVSISMAVNGGLFNYAGKAVGDTQNAIDKEKELSNGKIKIGDKWYASMDKYIESMNLIEGHDGETFSTPYAKTEKNNYEDEEKNKATIPAGFSVGVSEGINKISTGLVIRDEDGNEFVWIPVERLEKTYSYEEEDCNEPVVISDDEKNVNKYYKDVYTYPDDFSFITEYENMVKQVNEYGGFYIGRYETTIDENGKIGSKYNTKVLTAGDTFKYKDTEYYYRWYGLYYEQKKADVTGNGTDVQTAMIYGVLWDKTMDFIRKQKETGKTEYDVDTKTKAWHNYSKGILKSGQSNPKTETSTGDVALNIWDLESNGLEWSQEAADLEWRVVRGGYFEVGVGASARGSGHWSDDPSKSKSSRLALYII